MRANKKMVERNVRDEKKFGENFGFGRKWYETIQTDSKTPSDSKGKKNRKKHVFYHPKIKLIDDGNDLIFDVVWISFAFLEWQSSQCHFIHNIILSFSLPFFFFLFIPSFIHPVHLHHFFLLFSYVFVCFFFFGFVLL